MTFSTWKRAGIREISLRMMEGILQLRQARLKLGLCALILGMLAVFPVAGLAQTVTGSVFGTVADASGAVIPNAAVTLTNVLTGLTQTAKSNGSGNYIFPVVDPGSYTVSATSEGFQTETQRGVQVSVTQNVHANFSLAIGSASQTVTVSAATTLVDTRESQVGDTVDQQRIQELPINGRNPYSLVLLLPGVTNFTGNTNIGDQNGVTFSVNGNRAFENSYYLDGAFDTAVYRGGGNLIPNPDALAEFRLLTSNFDAEFGRSPGGVVNVITRSGTNAFHGLLYDYVRNNALNSKPFFNAATTPLVRNQFGGNFGGPIFRNKAFFFLSYEGLRIESPVIINGVGLTTPTPAEAKGDFRGDVGRANFTMPNVSCNGVKYVICPTALDPVAQNLLKSVPLADPVSFVVPDQSAPANQTANQEFARVDYQLNDAHKLSASYFLSRGYIVSPSQGSNKILGFSGVTNHETQANAGLNDTWIVSPNAVNSLRFFYTLNHYLTVELYKNNTWADLGSTVAQAAFPASQPAVTVKGFWSMGVGPDASHDQYDQSFGALDTYNLTHGNHTMKLGGSFLWSTWQESGAYLGTGTVAFNGGPTGATGNAMADFLEGKATTFAQNNGAYHRLHAPDPALFAQDDWRVTHKLTLDLGIRWEVYPPYVGDNDDGTFIPNVQSTRFPTAPLGLLASGDRGLPDGIRPTSYTKFAPRVGFAYDVFGNGRTSLHGAYGIFYSASHASLWENLEQQPFTLSVTTNSTPNLVTPYAPGADPFPYVVSTTNPSFTSGATVYGVPQGRNAVPYVEQYNLGVQQQLGTNWSAEAAYVGNVSHQFYVIQDINSPIYSPGLNPKTSTTTAGLNARRPYQPTPNSYMFGAIDLTTPLANASYNSLQVKLTRRFAHRFSLSASYVWSKSLDIYSVLEGTKPSFVDETNPKLDRGPSDIEIPQAFVASYLLAVPGTRHWGFVGKEILSGWQINGITTLQSGSPYTITSGADSNLDGLNIDRPNQVANPNLPGGRSRTEKLAGYFNTAAFAAVPAGTPYGNVRRNSMLGPGNVNTDISAFKTFAIWRGSNLQFRGEVYNLFNNVNLGNPTASMSSPKFGQITGAGAPRTSQLAVKFSF